MEHSALRGADDVDARRMRTQRPRPEIIVGYTTGVFDLFHAGHLALLKAARSLCDFLIVGVTTDELALSRKGQAPTIPLTERMAIVGSLRCVDTVVPQVSMDKAQAWQTLKFDVLFGGDNLRETPEWVAAETELAGLGATVRYLPALFERPGKLLDRDLDQYLLAD